MKKITLLAGMMVGLFSLIQLHGQDARLFVNQPIDAIPTRARLTSDQKYLYLLDRNRYTIRDAETRRIIVARALATDSKYGILVPDVSEDLHRLAYRDDATKTIEVIDAFTGKPFGSFKPPAYIVKLAISRDGNLIVAMTVKSGYYVYRYNEQAGYTGSEVVPYKDNVHPHYAVISPDSQYLALAESESDLGQITVIRLSDNETIYRKKSGFLFLSGHKNFIGSMFFSPNSRYLFSAETRGRAYVHDLQKSAVSIDTGGLFSVLNARFSDDGKIIFCPKSISLHSVRDGIQFSLCLPNDSHDGFGQLMANHTDSMQIRQLIPSVIPDVFPETQAELGERLFSSGDFVRAKHNAALKKSVTVEKTFMNKGSGKSIVYDHADGTAKQSKSFTLERIWNSYADKMDKVSSTDFALTDSGHLVLSGLSKQLKSYDLSGNKIADCAKSTALHLKIDVLEYFAPLDIIAAAEDANLIVWRKDCQNVTGLPDENGDIEEIKFDATGKYMMTRSQNGVFRLRSTSTLQTEAVLAFLSPDSWAVASSDGRYDGKGDALGLLHYVVSNEAVAISDFDKTFFTSGLLREILTGIKPANVAVNPKPVVKVDVSRSIVGKIHSVQNGDVMISGGRLGMGEKVYAIVDGKKIFLKVTFPMHTGAKSRTTVASDTARLGKGMPVFR